MKKNAFLLLFFLCITASGWAQKATSRKPMLSLYSKANPLLPPVIVKPRKPLKIKTAGGKKYTFEKYAISSDTLLISGKDTLAFSEIAQLKAWVKESPAREVLGTTLNVIGGFSAIGGVPTGMVYFLFTNSTKVFFLMAPGLALGVIGYILLKPRRFDTSASWQLFSVVVQK